MPYTRDRLHGLMFSIHSHHQSSSPLDPRKPTYDSTMLPQLDGSKTSKPSTTSTTSRCGLRTRIANLFGSKKYKPKAAEVNRSDEVDNASPMRVLTPRSTASVPPTSKPKHLSFSFRKRRSKTFSQSSTISAVHSHMTDMTGIRGNRLSPVSTIMIPKTSFQSPVRANTHSKGSTMSISVPSTPASPSREAALTSHPIVREREDESDESGKFVTPLEERDSAGFGTEERK